MCGSSADSVAACVVPLKCSNAIISIENVYFRHSINVKFGMQKWMTLSQHNHEETTHIEIIYDV